MKDIINSHDDQMEKFDTIQQRYMELVSLESYYVSSSDFCFNRIALILFDRYSFKI